MPETPTPEELEILVDPATKQELRPYDDGRQWYFVENSALSLGEVAHANLVGDLVKWGWWVSNGDVKVYRSIKEVPDKLFFCIYFKNAYFLKLYKSPD